MFRIRVRLWSGLRTSDEWEEIVEHKQYLSWNLLRPHGQAIIKFLSLHRLKFLSPFRISSIPSASARAS